MGSFKGHALPGTFFIIMGIWWTVKCILKYACKKHKRTSYLGSKALFQRIEVFEGLIIIGMAITGMIGEQFIPGGPHLALYNYKEGQWVELLNWHHFTMYFFFGLLGVANILCFIISSLPTSLTKLMLSNALFVEAFIMYNHTHGRDMLDIFVHQLLVLAIFVTGLIAFLELFIRTSITVELLRTSFIFLQGSWFWQIGFVLYPPSGGPAWDTMDHNNVMFLTICFCWHYALNIVVVGMIYAFVTWLVKSRLTRFCPSEVGLLKNAEREQESEEEM
ncbi:transmembrane protein 45A [Lycaon pictus]|nr:transmembrane protein 45A [Canis lupus familiaris]XP_005639455.1 transmembrane protein 45A [Canis lupus familiaris]XP_005639456.1 transmembrane protein 45A [Canis lupus familiaris]XP_005639458.1 transmembrane protein 45A [Canis lupus familiaris]XP_022269544.1 transmembrane protein 45A [Canis lupus familiaris]XP_025272240.1 transmembrane protein 45A [Canis lupus dingo]XP_025272247.1 transmembrane protein 45A [Canis lupus dingo]XP_025272255.1 transmembrane protein 45A [Canis lupus dingo]XP|eukprot:XP_005639454.1 transmembrane protein 45A [Canis lupus familiaris]